MRGEGFCAFLNAWKDGYYETYRLVVELPAVRLHKEGGAPGGGFFAVDTYNMSVKTYQNAMATIAKGRQGHSWQFTRPGLAWFCLLPGTTVNVGIVARQGAHEGGGLQFEHRGGPDAQLLDDSSDRKVVRL